MRRASRDRLVFTVEEAAALLGLARPTLYALVRAGEVPSVRLGRRVFVTAPTIADLTGVTPPSPAELADRHSADTRPAALHAIATGPTAQPAARRRPSPARDADDQRPRSG
jgi:excisionase family DNA binding protein